MGFVYNSQWKSKTVESNKRSKTVFILFWSLMKFTLTWMLRCEWDEIVKNRFSSSAPFPKSPTSIKSTGNSFAHHHQVSGYAKDKYRKPNIGNQISQTKYLITISKIANQHKSTGNYFPFHQYYQASWYRPKPNIPNPTIDQKYFKPKYWSQILKPNIPSPNIPSKNMPKPKMPKPPYSRLRTAWIA